MQYEIYHVKEIRYSQQMKVARCSAPPLFLHGENFPIKFTLQITTVIGQYCISKNFM